MLYTKKNPLKVVTPCTEEWRDVPGYDGLYQVSSLGRVRVLPRFHPNNGRGYTTKGRILSQLDNGHGYKYVRLNNKHKYVHALVAISFIPNPQNLCEINHKDENKQNNHLDNLEWCTHKYNSNYGELQKKIRVTKSKNNSDIKMIETRNQRKTYGAEIPVRGSLNGDVFLFKSLSDASRKTGVKAGHICMCCKGYRKTAGGYEWSYAN